MASFEAPIIKVSTGSAVLSSPRESAQRRTVKVFVIPGVALATFVGVILFFLGRPSEVEPDSRALVAQPLSSQPLPSQPPPSPTTVAQPPVAIPAVAKQDTVEVEIHVSPDTARVSIDGTEIGGSSVTGRYVLNDIVHIVRATAPGYVSKSVQVAFNANVKLELSLEHGSASPTSSTRLVPHVTTRPSLAGPERRISAVASEPSRPGDPAPPGDSSLGRPPPPEALPANESKASASPDAVDPAGGKKPHRPIDPSNPYRE